MPTKIEWCDETLNPMGWGCYGHGGTAENPARCPECYAHRLAKRGLRDCPECRAFVPHWHPEQLEKLYTWRKPRIIFVQDMGDMWHPAIPAAWIRCILVDEQANPRHTYLHLTKNPTRYLEFAGQLPRHNAWYGVTIRNQEEADRMIPILLQLAALGFKVFLSMEPLQGPVDLLVCNYGRGRCEHKALGTWTCLAAHPNWCTYNYLSHIHAVIVGGQTGPRAAPMHPDWVRSIRDQCQAAGKAFFFKQWGAWQPYPPNRKTAGRLLDRKEHNALPWRK